MKLLLATTNLGKVRELKALLEKAKLPFEVVGLDAFPNYQSPEENGKTFAENARLKATACAKATGLLCLADDSGLCVDALQGAPGVHSARFAGAGHNDAANIEKLLELLKKVPTKSRTAHFACALCLSDPNGVIAECEGKCAGSIAAAPKGQNGFGYDPVFLLPDGRTMAELSAAEKNLISHRGRAYQAVLPRLGALLDAPQP